MEGMGSSDGLRRAIERAARLEAKHAEKRKAAAERAHAAAGDQPYGYGRKHAVKLTSSRKRQQRLDIDATKRARYAALMETMQQENRAKHAALKREHFRLGIVELCLKKQPGYDWMSLRTIRESSELDPAEFLEQLEDDPNVEVEKDEKGTRLRYVVSSEYSSHVDVEYPVDFEYRTAVEETPSSAARAPRSATRLPDIETLDHLDLRFTKVQRIFNLVRKNDVKTVRREMPETRTSHLMTAAELTQRLNEPYEWSRYVKGEIFLIHLVRSKETSSCTRSSDSISTPRTQTTARRCCTDASGTPGATMRLCATRASSTCFKPDARLSCATAVG